jgi:hypothetical protein
VAGRKRAPRTGELSQRRLAAAQTPEARFAAATDLVRSTAARMSRKRDETGRAQATEFLDEATGYLLSLSARRRGNAA